MTGACSLCCRLGRVERHHPTRRPCRGAAYFDPGFVVELCVPCHARAHQVLRVAALDWQPPGAVPLGYRLSVTAAHVELFGAQDATFPIGPCSAPAVAGLIREAASALEARRSAEAGAA